MIRKTVSRKIPVMRMILAGTISGIASIWWFMIFPKLVASLLEDFPDLPMWVPRLILLLLGVCLFAIGIAIYYRKHLNTDVDFSQFQVVLWWAIDFALIFSSLVIWIAVLLMRIV
ncbi:MAG: hypothetical protein JW963_07810 [Anaerolineales bacterium]|nr:hypothetical protein [Anaerolineales bacterium]